MRLTVKVTLRPHASPPGSEAGPRPLQCPLSCPPHRERPCVGLVHWLRISSPSRHVVVRCFLPDMRVSIFLRFHEWRPEWEETKRYLIYPRQDVFLGGECKKSVNWLYRRREMQCWKGGERFVLLFLCANNDTRRNLEYPFTKKNKTRSKSSYTIEKKIRRLFFFGGDLYRHTV